MFAFFTRHPLIFSLMFALMLTFSVGDVSPAHAADGQSANVCQADGTDDITGENCLYLPASLITDNLFTGANIVIGALVGIVFLIAGFQFGGNILGAIAGIIGNFRVKF